MTVERFLLAQQGNHPTHQRDTFPDALAELRVGRKRTHWMWYVFPQISGLGSSEMAIEFGVRSMSEVVDYLTHPTLRDRYVECSRLVLSHLPQNEPVYDGLKKVLGGGDEKKFRSSITLFGEAARICDALRLGELADIWAELQTRGLRPCSATLDFVVASPPWCR